MKSKYIILTSILIISMFAACNKEDLVEYTNNPTEVTISAPEIHATKGQSVTINAQLTDDFGIKYVTLFSGGLSLNKQIGISSVNEVIAEYNFSYTFTIPTNLTSKEYIIQMKVKNLTGQITEKSFLIIVD